MNRMTCFAAAFGIGCIAWYAVGAAPQTGTLAQVSKRYETVSMPNANLDSMATWHDPTGKVNLYVTAKEADTVCILDATTGKKISTAGSPGKALGQLNRPNGVTVIGDHLLVVDRLNRRVQVFHLPENKFEFCFGEDLLINPYGIAASSETGKHVVFVTDQYDETKTAGKRVKKYALSFDSTPASATLATQFGEPTGPGALRTVESIVADSTSSRLYICDEESQDVKVYSFAGEFTGQVIGQGIIGNDPEGVALAYDSSLSTSPLLLLSDQGKKHTTFRVFDTSTGQQAGAFLGNPAISNTDGICLDAQPFDGFAEGAFFAVNNDVSVSVFSWSDIKQQLRLHPTSHAQVALR